MSLSLAPLFLAALLRPTQETPLAPMSSIEEADSRFARRAQGAQGDVAGRAEVDSAIEFYRKAVEASPDDFEILARLMRALHFRGAYTGADIEEKKRIFEEGRKLGQDAVDRIEKDVKATPG